MATVFEKHVKRWINCKCCDLCNGRKNVVLLRGAVPSKVLFIGEAPGESEDVLGIPFVGPAGRLLDNIIEQAGLKPVDHALTNIISCIPRDEDGAKITIPPAHAVKACAKRLQECVVLVDPALIVWVGAEARKWGPKHLHNILTERGIAQVEIIHPAAILRMNVSQRPLAASRSVVVISEAWDALQERK